MEDRLPVFKAEYLRVALGSAEKRISNLHEILMQEVAGNSVLAFGDEARARRRWEGYAGKNNRPAGRSLAMST